MRGLGIALGALAGAALAGSAMAALDANIQVARSDVEARRHCGPRPTMGPGWRCVGRPRPDPRLGAHMGGVRVHYTFRQITWTWVKGGKSASDSWTP